MVPWSLTRPHRKRHLDRFVVVGTAHVRHQQTHTHAQAHARTQAHAHRQTDRPRYICSNRPRHQSEILRFLVIQYLKTTFEQTASSLKVLSAETVRHWKASGMMLTDAGERLRINSVLITK